MISGSSSDDACDRGAGAHGAISSSIERYSNTNDNLDRVVPPESPDLAREAATATDTCSLSLVGGTFAPETPKGTEVPPNASTKGCVVSPDYLDTVAHAASVPREVSLPFSSSSSSYVYSSDREAAPLTAEECVRPVYYHPTMKRLLEWRGGMLHWIEWVPVFGRALVSFGPKLIFSLNASELLSKGLANNIIFYSFLPMFMYRFECSTVQYQRLYAVGGMGWSAKPLVALFSDGVAIFGYRRRWLLVLFTVIGALCSFAYAALPPGNASAVAAVSFYTVANYSMANLDILTEGLYARKIRAVPAAGVFLISSMWWMTQIGSMVGAFIQGPLSDMGHATVGGWVAGVCLVILLPVFILNGYEEQTNREERREDEAMAAAALAQPQDPRVMTDLGSADEPAFHEEKEKVKEKRSMVGEGERPAPAGDAVIQKGGLTTSVASSGASKVHLPVDAHCGVVEETLCPSGKRKKQTRTQMTHEGDADENERESEISSRADTTSSKAVDTASESGCFCCVDGYRSSHYMIEYNHRTWSSQYRLVVFCVIMTLVVIGLAVVTMVSGTYVLLGVSIGAAIVLSLLLFWSVPYVIAKAGFYAFLSNAVYVQISGSLNSFYLADEACVPNGPHFDMFFFYSVAAAVASLAGLLGVTLFAYAFSRRSYRWTFVITTFLRAAASISDLVLVMRWNRAIGIPDAVMYFFGDAVVYPLVNRLSCMPMVVLIAQLCPKGSEAMVYATLAAMSNVGGTMASEIGTFLLETIWPIRSHIPCDYHHLWKLIVAGHMVMPLMISPLIYWCIPAHRVCDPIMECSKTKAEVVEEQAASPLPPPPSKEEKKRKAKGEKEKRERRDD